MNYVPLYTKYRPQIIEEIVGQEHIKKALSNAITLSKVSHAYLFTGPRGTGKTSTARILAKSLNCKNGPTLTPCGVCESCQNIINTVPIDVIEIDAASNRKVEDTQEILEKIQYVPINGKYKIYIVDEVHMLSGHAFNALLKTLEEPPENVIFILATTEIQKVPDTIKSRCQRFDFRRITIENIVSRLRHISEIEKIKITDEALASIARSSYGGMRDSIGLLDQLSVFDKEITTDDVDAVLGRLSFETLKKLIDEIINSKNEQAIEHLEKIYNSGNEPLQILNGLLEYFRNLLIIKQCAKEQIPTLLEGIAKEQIEILASQSEKLEVHQLLFLIEKTGNYIREIKTTTNGRLWLEVAIIDLSALTVNTKLAELNERISALEQGGVISTPRLAPQPSPVSQIKTQSPIMPIASEPKKVEVEEKKEETSETKTPQKQEEVTKTEQKEEKKEEFSPMPKSTMGSKNSLSDLWKTILQNIQSPATQAILKWAIPIKIEEDEIIITFRNEALVRQANDSNKKNLIIAAAKKVFNGKEPTVVIRAGNGTEIVESSNKNFQKTIEEQNPPKNEVEEIQEQKAIKEDLPSDLEVQEGFEEIKKDTKKEEQKTRSDQTEMIIEVFSGRIMD